MTTEQHTQLPNNRPNISFIGVGNMAGAIIAGMCRNGFQAAQILGTTRSAESAARAAEAFGIQVINDNAQAVQFADVLVLAVKPQMMQSTCTALAAEAQARKPLVVSVAAGISAQDIAHWLGGDLAVIRCMPNTPALVGAGMSGLYANAQTSAEQKVLVEDMFRAVGKTLWVEEEQQMHIVTAISGSGPAYFFRFVEALISAGTAHGLNSTQAHQLATCTALGAARMMTETQDHPTLLRQKVTSPKGTTEQAILTFEREGIDTIVEHAVQACVSRSEELAALLAHRDV